MSLLIIFSTQKSENHSLTFAQISSIEPDVNEKDLDDDKAFFSLSI